MKAYLSLARFDNWTKNLLMLAGVGLGAWIIDLEAPLNWWPHVLLALLSLCLASSANYILNESTDSNSDHHHPIKKMRACVQYSLKLSLIITEYAAFSLAALLLAFLIHPYLAVTIAIYLACAWLYNIPPLRLKDVAYADILVESANYPLRLLVGWMCVIPYALPPSSVLITGWALGGFMMSVKRLAELQLFPDRAQAAAYRRSYSVYTPASLTCISLLFAMLCAFGIAIFLLKYHIEFLLAFPLITVWFVWYLALGLRSNEHAIYPEQLFRQKKLVAYSLGIFLLLVVLTHIQWPFLHQLSEPLYFTPALTGMAN